MNIVKRKLKKVFKLQNLNQQEIFEIKKLSGLIILNNNSRKDITTKIQELVDKRNKLVYKVIKKYFNYDISEKEEAVVYFLDDEIRIYEHSK